MTLIAHDKQYYLSPFELLALPLTGYTVASRHMELSEKESYWAHRIVAWIEYLPVVGCVVVVAEIFFCKVYYYACSFVGEGRALHQMHLKMIKNLSKARDENLAEARSEGHSVSLFAPLSEAVPSHSIVSAFMRKPLQFSHEVEEKQGLRPAMEDRQFYKTIEEGVVAGVFDGHGGDKVAEYVKGQLQARLPGRLKNCAGKVREAFQTLINEIQNEIKTHKDWDLIGTTCLVMFIDKKSHIAYTGTLGDSEANLFRKKGDKWSVVPLSNIRNWAYPKEAERLANSHNLPYLKDPHWIKARGGAKFVYSDSKIGGVNVSRGAGDVSQEGRIIQKWKMTEVEVKPGDWIEMGCDGVHDWLSKRHIAEVIERSEKESLDCAKETVRTALQKGSTDNVTSLFIKVR